MCAEVSPHLDRKAADVPRFGLSRSIGAPCGLGQRRLGGAAIGIEELSLLFVNERATQSNAVKALLTEKERVGVSKAPYSNENLT